MRMRCVEVSVGSSYIKFVAENRKDFRYAKGKSKFSEHVLNEGLEMKTIEKTMSIIHSEPKARILSRRSGILNQGSTKLRIKPQRFKTKGILV